MDLKIVFLQLLKPWSYLRIKADGKVLFDWIAPLALSLILTVLLVLAGVSGDVFSKDGLLLKMTAFIQSLPGFFIAALAAVATFNRNDLDELIPEPSPTLVIVQRGLERASRLTRRRFLCSLFSFLTAQSLLVTSLGVLATFYAPWVKDLADPMFHIWIKATFSFVYLLFFCQLMSITSMGLYYLGDRLLMPDE